MVLNGGKLRLQNSKTTFYILPCSFFNLCKMLFFCILLFMYGLHKTRPLWVNVICHEITTITCTNHFKHSIMVLSSYSQYSSTKLALVPYTSWWSATMHFGHFKKKQFTLQSNHYYFLNIIFTNNTHDS
jgi:hypothetical protein